MRQYDSKIDPQKSLYVHLNKEREIFFRSVQKLQTFLLPTIFFFADGWFILFFSAVCLSRMLCDLCGKLTKTDVKKEGRISLCDILHMENCWHYLFFVPLKINLKSLKSFNGLWFFLEIFIQTKFFVGSFWKYCKFFN